MIYIRFWYKIVLTRTFCLKFGRSNAGAKNIWFFEKVNSTPIAPYTVMSGDASCILIKSYF